MINNKENNELENNDETENRKHKWKAEIWKNVGCGETFRHKTQLYRHKKKCSGKSPRKNKGYKKVGNQIQCLKCEKLFSHQSNVTRHVNVCTQKEKTVHQCKFCDKIFQY